MTILQICPKEWFLKVEHAVSHDHFITALVCHVITYHSYYSVSRDHVSQLLQCIMWSLHHSSSVSRDHVSQVLQRVTWSLYHISSPLTCPSCPWSPWRCCPACPWRRTRRGSCVPWGPRLAACPTAAPWCSRPRSPGRAPRPGSSRRTRARCGHAGCTCDRPRPLGMLKQVPRGVACAYRRESLHQSAQRNRFEGYLIL